MCLTCPTHQALELQQHLSRWCDFLKALQILFAQLLPVDCFLHDTDDRLELIHSSMGNLQTGSVLAMREIPLLLEVPLQHVIRVTDLASRDCLFPLVLLFFQLLEILLVSLLALLLCAVC